MRPELLDLPACEPDGRNWFWHGEQILALLALAHFIRNGWWLGDLSEQDKAAAKAAVERIPA